MLLTGRNNQKPEVTMKNTMAFVFFLLCMSFFAFKLGTKYCNRNHTAITTHLTVKPDIENMAIMDTNRIRLFYEVKLRIPIPFTNGEPEYYRTGWTGHTIRIQDETP